MATRVLLADDHTIVRQGLRILLQREGFEVVGEAANGAEAVRLATETVPDVVVLDYGMPLMNGLGALTDGRDTDTTATTERGASLRSGSDPDGSRSERHRRYSRCRASA